MTKSRCDRCGDVHLCIPADQLLTAAPGTGFKYVKEFAEGIYIRSDDGRVRVLGIYDLYVKWCAMKEVVPTGLRRFNRMLQALGWEKERVGGYYYWTSYPINQAAAD